MAVILFLALASFASAFNYTEGTPGVYNTSVTAGGFRIAGINDMNYSVNVSVAQDWWFGQNASYTTQQLYINFTKNATLTTVGFKGLDDGSGATFPYSWCIGGRNFNISCGYMNGTGAGLGDCNNPLTASFACKEFTGSWVTDALTLSIYGFVTSHWVLLGELYAFGTDLNVSGVIVIDNLTYRNFSTFLTQNYTRQLYYNFTYNCTANNTFSIIPFVNFTPVSSSPLTCNGVFNDAYAPIPYNSEGLFNVSLLFNSSNASLSRMLLNRTFFFDMNNPTPTPNTYFPNLINNNSVNTTALCTDTSGINLTYNLTFNNNAIIFGRYANGTTLINNSLALHGINNATLTCGDFFANVTTTDYQGVYLERIKIYDLLTLNPLIRNTTINFLTNVSGILIYTNTTLTNFTGWFLNVTLPADYYTAQFIAPGYQPKSYVLENYSFQNINAYLLNGTNYLVFTVVDADSSTTLVSGVLVEMYGTVGSNLTLLESHYTDIVGQAQFSYDTSQCYTFSFSKVGYLTKVFTLCPVITPSYTIKLQRIGTLINQPDYTQVMVSYEPTTFSSPMNTHFNFTISSPTSILTAYAYNITYPGGSIAHSGTSATGETFSDSMIIATVPAGSVNITYWYNSTLSGYRSFFFTYRLNTPTNLLIVANQGETYGLGLYERTLIASIITIFVAGIGGLAAGFAAGLALALLVIVFMLYIGFVSWWAFIGTVAVAALILYWRVDI